jgi:hypothetical protein
MKMQSRFGLASAVLLVIPTFTQAQRAMGSFRAAPSVPASAPVAHSTAVRGYAGNRMNSARAVRAGSPAGMNAPADLVGSNGLSVQQILNPFPSYGFDFEHLAAIHKDDDIKALIDPATQAKLALAERRRRRRPKTGNGFIFLDGGGAYVLPVDPGAGVNPDADAQAAQDQGQDQGQGQNQGAPPAESNDARLAQEQSESLPDEGEFTLILRSGQEIEAVAFTRVNDRIVYITTGGGRRTVAVREVDVDATVRLNQERGTPLQIPL